MSSAPVDAVGETKTQRGETHGTRGSSGEMHSSPEQAERQGTRVGGGGVHSSPVLRSAHTGSRV